MNLRICCLLLLVCFFTLNAEDAEQKAIIEKKMEAYTNTYNIQDAKGLADFWEEDGQFIHPKTGQVIKGKKAIEDFFTSRFQTDKDMKLEVKISRVTITDQDAIATGLFHVIQADQPVREIAFKAYLEQHNGNWLLDEIRQVDIAEVPDHYQHLKELEWLIGDWIDADEDAEIHISYSWDRSKNFISKKFSLATEGKLELEGTQMIGWDPIQETIRSWFFDTDGTFGEATWTRKEKNWVVTNKQTLADGTQGSSIHIYTPINAESYSWAAYSREVGGQILPDIAPIIIVRKKG